jgi:hypothetical protein
VCAAGAAEPRPPNPVADAVAGKPKRPRAAGPGAGPRARRSKDPYFMNVFLWIVQALLAAMFAMAGAMKATQPKDKAEERVRQLRVRPGRRPETAPPLQPVPGPREDPQQGAFRHPLSQGLLQGCRRR